MRALIVASRHRPCCSCRRNPAVHIVHESMQSSSTPLTVLLSGLTHMFILDLSCSHSHLRDDAHVNGARADMPLAHASPAWLPTGGGRRRVAIHPRKRSVEIEGVVRRRLILIAPIRLSKSTAETGRAHAPRRNGRPGGMRTNSRSPFPSLRRVAATTTSSRTPRHAHARRHEFGVALTRSSPGPRRDELGRANRTFGSCAAITTTVPPPLNDANSITRLHEIPSPEDDGRLRE